MITKDENFLWISLLLLPLGMMFDLFDGKVARWRRSASLLGQELDSLADLVKLNFIFFVYYLYLNIICILLYLVLDEV